MPLKRGQARRLPYAFRQAVCLLVATAIDDGNGRFCRSRIAAGAFLGIPAREPGVSLKTPLGERLAGFYKPPPQPFQPDGDHRGNFGRPLGLAVLSAGFLPGSITFTERWRFCHGARASQCGRVHFGNALGGVAACSLVVRPRLSPRSSRCLNEVGPVCCWPCHSR